MKRCKVLSLLLALVLMLSLAAGAPWYAAAQAYVTERGLMTADGGFAPEAPADAQDLLAALYALEGRPAARTGDGFAVWQETLPAAVPAVLIRGEVREFLLAYAASRGFDADDLMIGVGNGNLMLDRTPRRSPNGPTRPCTGV